eukprot:9351604-Pyramimonas_sp.AAC.1
MAAAVLSERKRCASTSQSTKRWAWAAGPTTRLPLGFRPRRAMSRNAGEAGPRRGAPGFLA